ncbi:presenilin family intramembrane aspartyl protease PSH [Halorientalis marina]|uniref:presenilin family intramembrane aspartyl protease PSH n=1 Tax=Halorientalis marina TaxID=2931976 RepID=UPI001FF52FB9|nr:presenilin family intramembrane aspartyl protease PSH [Halorientalis marina]
MDKQTRAYVAVAGIVGMFLLVQLGALALVEPFKQAGLQAVEDPQDPTNAVVYVAAILVATGVMLVAIKLAQDRAIRALLVFTGVYLSWFVLQVVVPAVVVWEGFNVLAVVIALLLGVALYVHPEWYVIDTTGIVMGAGGAGLFGISFGLLPAILLLTILAIYDAISVYGTEHMLTLASGMMDLKVPIVFVVPLSLSYSYLDADMPDPTGEVEDGADAAAANGGTEGGASADPAESEESEEGMELERDALFIGLGDAVIPTVLVASAAFFAPSGIPAVSLPGLFVPLPALTAMVGTMLGLLVLLRMVLKGRAHAGLPLLNGGTIAGYLVGALASGIPILQALGVAQYL